jgi:hypothetical protein
MHAVVFTSLALDWLCGTAMAPCWPSALERAGLLLRKPGVPHQRTVREDPL